MGLGERGRKGRRGGRLVGLTGEEKRGEVTDEGRRKWSRYKRKARPGQRLRARIRRYLWGIIISGGPGGETHRRNAGFQ
jgi:hypothetical protein